MEGFRGALKDLTKGLEGLSSGLDSLVGEIKGDLSKEQLLDLNKTIRDFNPEQNLKEMRSRLETLKKKQNDFNK